MKKFLLKLLLFSIGLLLLLYSAQWIVDGGLRSLRNNDVYGDWNRIFAGEVDVDVVILGNSRAWIHINPDLITRVTGLSAYNLGVDGADITLQRAKWLSYFRNNRAPKYVVQDIEIFEIDKGDELYGKIEYLPYLDKEEVYGVVCEYDEMIPFERWIPLVKYRGFVKAIALGTYGFCFGEFTPLKSIKKRGFHAADKKWDDYDVNFKQRLKSDTIITKRFINPALVNLIRECKEAKIHLVFVHGPYYHELLQIIPQQQEFLDYFKQLALDPDIEFWDFSIMENLSYNRDYFYNATHLNRKGAAIYSDSIAHRLKWLDAVSKP
ncbi:MAG: hypothetical protein ACWA6U_05425 [Breznakibacter sp.]